MQHSRRLPGALLRRMRVPAALSPSVVSSVRRRGAPPPPLRVPPAGATRLRCVTRVRIGAAVARAGAALRRCCAKVRR